MRERSVIRVDLSRISAIALVAALGGAGFVSPAAAAVTPLPFDFNEGKAAVDDPNDPNPAHTININCQCDDKGSSYIQSYMIAVLKASGFVDPHVVVTGAVGQVGVPSGSNSGSYTGDGHVVGTTNTTSGSFRALTLADTEGFSIPGGTGTLDSGTNLIGGTGQSATTDGYIKNCTSVDGSGHCTPTSDQFTIQITNLKDSSGKSYEISSLSFDFEIFPDGTCASTSPSSSCGGSGLPNLPDITVLAHGTIDGLPGAQTLNLLDVNGVTPSGSYKRSYTMSTETAPQLLGVSGPISFNTDTHISQLDFVDWPATIGIDNLTFGYRETPEPGTLAMFAVGLLGIAGIARRRRARPAV